MALERGETCFDVRVQRGVTDDQTAGTGAGAIRFQRVFGGFDQVGMMRQPEVVVAGKIDECLPTALKRASGLNRGIKSAQETGLRPLFQVVTEVGVPSIGQTRDSPAVLIAVGTNRWRCNAGRVRVVTVVGQRLLHRATHLELDRALLGHLDRGQGLGVLRGACTALLHFEDAEITKFEPVALAQFDDDVVEKSLDDFLDRDALLP